MKNDVIVPVYCEGDLTPKAIDVVKGIVAEKFPNHNVILCSYDGDSMKGDKVLVLGKVTEAGAILPQHRPVYTYSVAQIMTKANAATILAAGIQQFITTPEPPPFDGPVHTASPLYVTSWLDLTKPIAIDIETSGNLGVTHTPEEVELLSIGFYQPGHVPIVLVSHREDGTDKYTHPFDKDELAMLGHLLSRIEKPIWHNGKFDTRVLNRLLGIKVPVWFDTMLAHHTLNQAAGQHGLKALAQLYFGAPDWEAGLSKYTKNGGHYELIPRSVQVEYNGWDVYWTYKLWELLAPQIEADENAEVAFMLEMQYAEFLLKVEQRGIPFNKQYARTLADQLEFDRLVSLEQLRGLAMDANFNPNSHVQVKRILSEVFDVIVDSTKEDVILELKSHTDKGSPFYHFLDELIKYRKTVKMKGTYAEGWAKHERNGTVHPTFLVHGTSTGRLSSTGPNAQNVPREKRIRKMVGV